MNQLVDVLGPCLIGRKFETLLQDVGAILLITQFGHARAQLLKYGLTNMGRPPSDDLGDCIVAVWVTCCGDRILAHTLHDTFLLFGIAGTGNDDFDNTKAVAVDAKLVN